MVHPENLNRLDTVEACRKSAPTLAFRRRLASRLDAASRENGFDAFTTLRNDPFRLRTERGPGKIETHSARQKKAAEAAFPTHGC
jgi:hypothetical protein